VEFHRANIMHKLDVKNTIELVRLVLGDPANA
jgi:DNA-binding CsgD family transcriptional regulator